jgi:predicted dehydrogenase
MDSLSIGVIGLGLGHHHVAAYAQATEVARLVICDTDPARLEQTQEAFEINAAYQDIETMLRTERLDAVSIVTPDHLHRPHATSCLEAGCHVLLTKPLATNLADARAIVRCAETTGRKLMVAHERRFRSRVIKIKELLTSGALGQIIHLRIDAIQDKRRQFQRSPWYASAEAGRTALVGSGIHEVDQLRYFMDRPIVSVFALSNRLGSLDFPADKTTAALYRFTDPAASTGEGGAIGQVTVTYEAHNLRGSPPNTGFHLVATKGTIIGNRFALDDQGEWQDLPCDEHEIVTGTYGCVENFLDAIVHDTPLAVSGREAFASLAACVAADTSAATGRPTIPETYE